MNKKAAIPAIYIILGIILLALAVPKILNLQKSQTTLYSIAGERWGCDDFPKNIGPFNEGGEHSWYHTVQGGTNFQASASQYCGTGKALFDTFIDWQKGSTAREYRGDINYNCPTGKTCQVQLYCCAHGYECTSDADCSWVGSNSLCQITTDIDNNIVFDWMSPGASWHYCTCTTNNFDHRCWGIINNACVEKLPPYKQCYLDDGFNGKCPVAGINPYNYESLVDCQAANLCTSGQTKECTDSDGCVGTQTCANGVWGTCICGAGKCGTTPLNSYCPLRTQTDWLSRKFNVEVEWDYVNDCTSGFCWNVVGIAGGKCVEPKCCHSTVSTSNPYILRPKAESCPGTFVEETLSNCNGKTSNDIENFDSTKLCTVGGTGGNGTGGVTTDYTPTQYSLTSADLQEVTSSMIMQSVCSVNKNCLPYEPTSSDETSADYTVQCKSTAITKSRIEEASTEVCKGYNIFSFKFVASTSAAICSGALAVSILTVGAATPVTATICALSIVGGFTAWTGGYAIETGCEIVKQKGAEGLCIATKKGGTGGFCVSVFNDWLSPYTGVNDCQTNTIIFLLIIGGGIIIFSRLVG